MPEHQIRLRGPWELLPDVQADPNPIRLDLPTLDLPPAPGPLVLQRRFGRPIRLPPGSSCRLRAEDVPGLVLVSLNEVELAGPDPIPRLGADCIDLEIGHLLWARNLLRLTVDPMPSSSDDRRRPWGQVSLLFAEDDQPDR